MSDHVYSNMSSKYLSLKVRELRSIGINPSSEEINSSLNDLDLFYKKKKLLNSLQFKVLNARSVTKVTTENTQLMDINIKYDYQRQGIFLEEQNTDLVYQLSKDLKPDFTILTNSGQSATFGLFQFFKLFWPELNEVNLLNKRNYHESFDVLKRVFQFDLKRFDSGKVLNFYDSGVSEESLQSTIEENDFTGKVVLIDTSCFDLSNPDLRTSLKKLINNNVTVFLLRSHIKLDCFGGEYNLFGTIVSYNIKGIDKSIDYSCLEGDTVLSYYGRTIYGAINKMLALTGGHANLPDVYPFLKSKEFRKLTLERTKRIQENCIALEKLAQEILDIEFSFKFFEHKLFFVLVIQAELSKEQFTKCVSKAEHLTKLKIMFCDSFGFDFPNIAMLAPNESYFPKSTYRLRISPGDVPIGFSNSHFKLFEAFFKALVNQRASQGINGG